MAVRYSAVAGFLIFFPLSISTASAQTYDVVKDFSSAKNPNNVWSYLGNNTVMNTVSTNGRCNGWPVISGLLCWTNHLNQDFSASIMRNPTGKEIKTLSVTVPVDHVVMFPASGFMTVQWKSPEPGKYSIVGDFLSTDTAQSRRYVQINRIGTQDPLFRSNVYPKGNRAPFNIVVTVPKDQLIQFTVQGGATPYNNNVALAVKITRLH